MKRSAWFDKVADVADANGWNVYEPTDEEHLELEFSAYTPAGQDYMFSVVLERGKGAHEFLEEIDRHIDGFDVDYETYLWIGGDGHGRNGASYHIKDIVADMEAALQMVKDLRDALQQSLQADGTELVR